MKIEHFVYCHWESQKARTFAESSSVASTSTEGDKVAWLPSLSPSRKIPVRSSIPFRPNTSVMRPVTEHSGHRELERSHLWTHCPQPIIRWQQGDTTGALAGKWQITHSKPFLTSSTNDNFLPIWSSFLSISSSLSWISVLLDFIFLQEGSTMTRHPLHLPDLTVLTRLLTFHTLSKMQQWFCVLTSRIQVLK